MTTPIYPNILIPPTSEDSSKFSVISRVRQAMERAGVPANKIDEFNDEAVRGRGFPQLLATVEKWVTVKRWVDFQ